MLNCTYSLDDFFEKQVAVQIDNYTQYEELESWFCSTGVHIGSKNSNHKYVQHHFLDGDNIAIAVFSYPISKGIELFPALISKFDNSWQMVQFNELFKVIEINQSQLEEILL